MPSLKEVASVALISAGVMALVFRLDMARELVTGIKKSDGAAVSKGALYI